MDYTARPFRSMLYIPASNARALAKAQTLATDAIIFDLEDAVAPDAKADARDLLAQTLKTADYGNRTLLVRINALDTAWGNDDLNVICDVGPEAILLPKVYSADEISNLSSILDKHPKCKNTRIWAMMETPLCVFNAAQIAAAPRMSGFVLGTNDLLKDIGGQKSTGREALITSLQLCVLAARAHGLICIDGVYNAFKDDEGLTRECSQGVSFGFDGKSLIHPAQLPITNDLFSPSEALLDKARRHVAAFADAQASGLGIAVVDGEIVENLHVVAANALLAKAEAITAMEG